MTSLQIIRPGSRKISFSTLGLATDFAGADQVMPIRKSETEDLKTTDVEAYDSLNTGLGRSTIVISKINYFLP